MEFEDHVVAVEAIVRQLERGDMRLNEAIEAFREACAHVQEGERLLEAARVEVYRLVDAAANGAGDRPARTEPLTLG